MVPQKLINATIKNALYIERYKQSEVNEIVKFLRGIDKIIRDELAGPNLTEYARAKLEKQLSLINDLISVKFDKHYSDFEKRLSDLAQTMAESESAGITAASASKDFEAAIPTAAQIRSAVFSNPLSLTGPDGGKLLEPFYRDWAKKETDSIIGAIRQGYFQGKTNQEISAIVRGTLANKYSDGKYAELKRHAEAIVRTAVQHAATQARIESMIVNYDVCEGYRWLSTLDSRTSAQCRHLSNEVFEFGKGPVPPVHINCRSTIIPELSDEFDWLSEGRTQSSIVGYVDADTTYYDWLGNQPEEIQDDVLGKKRGEIFRRKGMTEKKYKALTMGKNLEPLTLVEIREKQPSLFD